MKIGVGQAHCKNAMPRQEPTLEPRSRTPHLDHIFPHLRMQYVWVTEERPPTSPSWE